MLAEANPPAPPPEIQAPVTDPTTFTPPVDESFSLPGQGTPPQRLLPSNATPLENTLERLITPEILKDVDLRSLWNPLTCPERLLPYLAWAVSVDVWDDDWTEEVKRNVVATSLLVHREKGTPDAMRRALDALGLSVAFDEWFDYGGDPYTFRLHIPSLGSQNEGQSLGVAEQETAIIAANAAKNTRSVLSGVTISGCTDLDAPRVGIAGVSGVTAEILPAAHFVP